MKTLVKLDKAFLKLEEWIVVLCIWCMAVLLIGNVIGRTGFHRTLDFAEEVASFLALFCTFVGLSYCSRIGRHITMTAVYDRLGEKGQKVFYLIVCFVTFAVLCILSWFAFGYVGTLRVSGRVTNALLMPYWIPYLVVAAALVIGAIQYLILFIKNLITKGAVVTALYPQEEEYAFSEDLEDETPAVENLQEGGREQ